MCVYTDANALSMHACVSYEEEDTCVMRMRQECMQVCANVSSRFSFALVIGLIQCQ
jgi:hypothetical protein